MDYDFNGAESVGDKVHINGRWWGGYDKPDHVKVNVRDPRALAALLLELADAADKHKEKAIASRLADLKRKQSEIELEINSLSRAA